MIHPPIGPMVCPTTSRRLLEAMRHTMWVLALTLLAGAAGSAQEPARRPRFPHGEHARLFPSCTSCHAGIVSGDSAARFPAAASCTACHNGRDVKVVSWSGPTKRVTNLVFSHARHAAASRAGGEPATCASCHARGADTAWMRVAGASPATCIGCHAHQAPEHLAEGAACGTCHRPLTEARELPVARIAAFPKPASHGRPDFLAAHAPGSAAAQASCATCHARESCARCHTNVRQSASIARLASDDRVASIVRELAPAYPTPASHRDASWPVDHGRDAKRDVLRCANCHAQPSCQSCHTGTKASAAIAQLPVAEPGAAPGVLLAAVAGPRAGQVVARPPEVALAGAAATDGRASAPASARAAMKPIVVRVHAPDFALSHRATAASGRLDCAGCHAQRTCTECHAGASTRRFHANDFMSRHATEAYSAERNCASCHRTETFCRSCHQKTGLASRGTVNVAAHTRQPLWLLQHGQAAREGLTGCTSCHQQRDCLRCHSSQGLHVSPHGAGFDASRMASRNRQVCATCHLTDPLRR